MRNLSANALAKIAQKQGTEPVNIVEIQWHIGGPWFRYADRQFFNSTPQHLQGHLLDLSPLDDIIKVSQNQTTAELTVKLDDENSQIREIINRSDIHFRMVRIYQWFSDLDLSDAFLLFQGKINSPIVYSDADRTLTFNVLSELESTEIGFQPEQGVNFGFISDQYFDRPWPLVFGTVNNLPGVLVYKIPQGQTTRPLSMTNTCRSSVLDGMAQASLEKRNISAQLQSKLAEGSLRLAQYLSKRRTQTEEAGFREAIYEANRQASEQATLRLEEIDRQMLEVQLQAAYEQDEPDYGTAVGHVIGGRYFPQNQIVTIKINDAFFTGRFNGDTFFTMSAENPNGECEDSLPRITSTEKVTYTHYDDETNEFKGLVISTQWKFEPVSRPQGPTNTYWFADGGSTVELVSNARELYVVNILPSIVHGVYAKKGAAGIETLQPLPASYYTVRHIPLNANFTATVVELRRALSSYEQGWSDGEIFVNLTSPIGPNTAVILSWLITTFSDYGVDATSFNNVANALVNYPSHFALFEMKQFFSCLEEIAWQARCRIWLDGQTFKLQYLSTEPTSVDSITASDIAMESLQLSHTPSEDIVTKLRAEWKRDYAQEEPNVVTVKYNVQKYGTHERTFDFYIYNIVDLVIKSAQFWAMRMGNTWKLVSFKTFLHKLNIETFDCITFNLPGYYTDAAVKSLVEDAALNSASNEIDITLWLPVRAGTMVPYVFAWPADASVELFWPTPDEVYAAPVSPGDNSNGAPFNLPRHPNNSDSSGGGSRPRRPSDSADASQPTPTFNNDNTPTTNVPTPFRPIRNALGLIVNPEKIEYNPPDPKLSTIDIRSTRVVDSATDRVGRLSHVLQLVKNPDNPGSDHPDNDLVVLWNFARMSDVDGGNVKTISFEYDGELEFFRPSASFWLNDPDAEKSEKDNALQKNAQRNSQE